MIIVTKAQPNDKMIEFIFLGFFISMNIFSKVQQIGQIIASNTHGIIDLSAKLSGGPTKNRMAMKPNKTPNILKNTKSSVFRYREQTYVSIGTNATDIDNIPAGTLLAAI